MRSEQLMLALSSDTSQLALEASKTPRESMPSCISESTPPRHPAGPGPGALTDPGRAAEGARLVCGSEWN